MRFPIGGERQPVYNFLRYHGFVMSKWSDKVWYRADGVEASVYGAGSKARIHDGAGKLLADGPLEEAVLHLNLNFT